MADDDNDRIEQRYRELKEELEAGQRQLEELERRKTDLERTLLRIGGAIQVLEELREEKDEGSRADDMEAERS